jgi:hypothetical protein
LTRKSTRGDIRRRLVPLVDLKLGKAVPMWLCIDSASVSDDECLQDPETQSVSSCPTSQRSGSDTFLSSPFRTDSGFIECYGSIFPPKRGSSRNKAQTFYTELSIDTFLYHPSRGFSPHLVSVSSRYAHRLIKSSCLMTRVSFPVSALYISSITSKSVGKRMSK